MEWLNKKLVITMGTGGVGKTTVSAAMGIKAAMQGKKVLVLTIDPSKRLKTALGFESLGLDPQEVPLKCKGSLYASVLEPKKVFDRFVGKHAKSDEIKNKILGNRLYKKISSSLAGSQEFTSLEAVLTYIENNEYDLIILDTPPATNSVDFLRAPQKFYRLFDEKVLNWFQDSRASSSWLKKAFSSGTKKAMQVLERLVGNEFLGDIYSFFQVIGEVAPALRERSLKSQHLFASEDTAFSLVSIYDEAKLEEAHDLYKSLKREGYNLTYIFINKAFPFLFVDSDEKDPLKMWQNKFEHQKRIHNSLGSKFSSNIGLFQIEEQVGEITNLEALIKLGDAIKV